MEVFFYAIKSRERGIGDNAMTINPDPIRKWWLGTENAGSFGKLRTGSSTPFGAQVLAKLPSGRHFIVRSG
jgi:hypothetical protein